MARASAAFRLACRSCLVRACAGVSCRLADPMRELEPLSFDRALREAARELERRKLSGESPSDALPDFLLDEETLHWLRELRGKDPLAPSLEGWLLRLREQARFGSRRSELRRAHRSHPH